MQNPLNKGTDTHGTFQTVYCSEERPREGFSKECESAIYKFSDRLAAPRVFLMIVSADILSQ